MFRTKSLIFLSVVSIALIVSTAVIQEAGATLPGAVNINDSLSLDALNTVYNPSDTNGGQCPAGIFTISATFTNVSSSFFVDIAFEVARISTHVSLLGMTQNVSTAYLIVLPDYLGPDRILSPGESFSQDFRLCLNERRAFVFFVDAFGVPLNG